mmetsp:Transcript_17622/g.33130  ORF Transcript_17622/g.33130 Transcript_17622/m.33130 type:complete len:284 (-) Transcript_17622:608-1459(-)
MIVHSDFAPRPPPPPQQQKRQTCQVWMEARVCIILIHNNNNNNNNQINDDITIHPPSYDLTQAAEWMKWIEETEHRWTHHGGAGAYDTLRCDVQLPIHKDDDPNSSNNDNISNNKHHIKVWGQDFHLDRLERSYRSLLSSHMTNTDNQDNDNLETRLHQARTASYRILEALLEEAKTATIFHPSQQQPQPQSDDNYDSEDVTIQLIRVTWLWSPATSPSQPEDKPDNNNEDDDDKDDYTMIIVRGHAVCSTRPIRIHQPVTPIVCTLAVADRRHSNNNNNNHK